MIVLVAPQFSSVVVWARRVVCLCLLCGFAWSGLLSPPPAQAVPCPPGILLCPGVKVRDALQELASYGWLGRSIAKVASWVQQEIFNRFEESAVVIELKNWVDTFNLWPVTTQAEIGARATATKVQETLMQAWVDSMHYTSSTQVAAAIASHPAHVPPAMSTTPAVTRSDGTKAPPSDDVLCDLVNTSLVTQYTYLYISMPMQEALAQFVSGLFLGEDHDGVGPEETATEMALRCNLQLFNPLSGADPKCNASEPKPGEIDFRDADSNSRFLMSGREPLEFPQMVQMPGPGGATAIVPVPQNANQKAWVATLYYLARMARRPTPPYGDVLKTDAGRTAMMNWAHCANIQMNAMAPVMRRFAEVARPNCDDTRMKKMCDLQNMKCEVARSPAFGSHELPPSFGDCKRGLSEVQAKQLDAMLCLSAEFAAQRLAAGRRVSQAIPDLARCQALASEDQGNWIGGSEALRKAAVDVLNLQSCWSGGGGPPPESMYGEGAQRFQSKPRVQPVRGHGGEKGKLLKAL